MIALLIAVVAVVAARAGLRYLARRQRQRLDDAATRARLASDHQDNVTRLILAGSLEFTGVDEHGHVTLALTRRSPQ